MEDILFDLYYRVAHRNEELEQTVEELQNDLQHFIPITEAESEE